ncbi:MAG: hypothetical protein WB615_05230 [Candidatus Tumulicola sp.]
MPTSDERRFEEFLAEFTPEAAALGRAAVKRLRKRLPSADVMIYDNYNFLVAGFSPNERPSDAVFSIVMSARGVALCFLEGAGLPDPHHILRGSGRVVRNVRLDSTDDFARPEVAMLVEVALDHARVAFDPDRAGRFYVKSVTARKRARRKPATSQPRRKAEAPA